MSGAAALQTSFDDKLVAITGRMASMSRKEAVERIGRAGGEYARSATQGTDFLVVGQEGWPLSRDGGLTQHLVKAKELQQQGGEVQILTEEGFLDRLGLGDRQPGIRRLYTIEQLSRILRVDLRGRLGAAEMSQLRTEFQRQLDDGHESFLIHLERLEEMTLAGAAFLVGLLRAAQEKGGRVSIMRPSDEVRKALELHGVLSLIHIVSTPQEFI